MQLINIDFFDLNLGGLPIVVFNNVPLFDKNSGLQLLLFCEKNNISVLGIEGFKVDGDTRIPVMECIADFSSLVENCSDLSETTIFHAREFIQKNWKECSMMEFVLCKEIA